MKRAFSILGIGIIVVGVVLAIAIAVLNAFFFTPERLESRLSGLFGREVAIRGDVELSVWGEPRLSVSKIQLQNPPGSAFKHLLTLESLSVGLRWWDVPLALVTSHHHFLDIRVAGGKVHIDGRADVVGDDGVWPSADDPFTSALAWLNSLVGEDLQLEVQADGERIDRTRVHQVHLRFATGKAGAVVIDAEEFSLSVNDFPMKGALALYAPIVSPDHDPPASLHGRVEIEELRFSDMVAGGASEGGGRILGAQPLPTHTCRSWDVGLDLSLGSVQVGGSEIKDIKFNVKSSAGTWSFRLVNAQFPAGEGHAEVSLECGSLPGVFSLHSGVRSKGTSRFAHEGASVEVLGRMESLLDLKGRGGTRREIVEDLSGRFVVFLGPVETGKLEDRFYSKGLFHALTVSWRQSEKADVDCAVIDMKVKNGVAKSEQIVIATPTLVIDGHGHVSLAEDNMEIFLIPRPKHARLGSVHVPVLVSGRIEKPHVGLDWRDVLPRLGIETGTALIEPILENLPFDGLAKEEREACRRALLPIDGPPA